MSLLEKMIEKIGLGYEEYDDEDDAIAEQVEVDGEGMLKQSITTNDNDTSVPPEFLQHLQRKSIPMKQMDTVKSRTNDLNGITMTLQRSDVGRVKEKRKALFGGKNLNEDKNAVSALARAMHVLIVTPKDFDDSQKIADHIKNDQSVIINCEKIDEVVTSRIKDFICGVVYALGGTVQKISETSMFCAPRSVDVKTKQGFVEDDFDEE